MEYQQHYDLQAALAAEGNLIPPPRLFDFDETQIYAAMMDRLAQPQANGTPSPFSSKNPGSAHGTLMAAITEMIALLGYEMDRVPDRAWLHILRLLGTEIPGAEFPVVSLTFFRDVQSVNANLPATIPIGTTVTDRFGEIRATTLYSITIAGGDTEGTVSARLNTFGAVENYQVGILSTLPADIPFVAGVFDTEILSSGQDELTLGQVAGIVRSGVRTGNLGRYRDAGLVDSDDSVFLGRCVTFRDYVYYAKRLGATKANAFKGVQVGVVGYFGDLTTLVVYPESARSRIDEQIRSISIAGGRLDVIAATVIPLDGTIIVRAAVSLSEATVRDLVAEAIVDKINPPNGVWGDPQFLANLATAIELVQGIYAVSSLDLKHSLTNVPFSTLTLKPWHLLEIQNTVQIQVLR